MTTDIAVVERKSKQLKRKPQPKKLVEREQVVMARNPEELNIAQQQMVVWADNRIADARDELRDLEANLLLAQQNDWQPGNWKRQMGRVKDTIIYYGKVRAALLEGYCIVPNFPIDVFAVKTRKKKPNKVSESSTWRGGPTLPDMRPDKSPVGEGDYVAPETLNDTWEEEHDDEKNEGKTKTWFCATASEMRAPEFPFTLVKPEILEDVSFAKTIRIFDELGVMPERRRRSGGDPVVIGRIRMSNSWSSRTMCFLLSWWVRPEEF